MEQVNKLENGLTLIHKQIEGLTTAAYSLIFGAGLSLDPNDKIGLSLALTDFCGRQAGKYNQREFLNLFDSHGINHNESAKLELIQFNGTCLGPKLEQALELLSLMYTSPNFDAKLLPSIKVSLEQDVIAVKDNPMRLALQNFNSKYFQDPFNRPSVGTLEGVKGIEIKDLEAAISFQNCSEDTILSIVSSSPSDDVLKTVNQYFGSSPAESLQRPQWNNLSPQFKEHIEYDSAQVQIVLGFNAAKLHDPEYYIAKVINGVLSGGMFGRLFLEVREKRGLCYSVFSSYAGKKDYGRFICYAGTTTERAAETLSVILEVLNNLNDISDQELDRAKTDLLSNIIIARETSLAKAASVASDWKNFERIRTIDEITEKILSVNQEQISNYLKTYPFENYSILTLGKEPIN